MTVVGILAIAFITWVFWMMIGMLVSLERDRRELTTAGKMLSTAWKTTELCLAKMTPTVSQLLYDEGDD